MGTEFQLWKMEKFWRRMVAVAAQYVNGLNATELHVKNDENGKFYVYFTTIKKERDADSLGLSK